MRPLSAPPAVDVAADDQHGALCSAAHSAQCSTQQFTPAFVSRVGPALQLELLMKKKTVFHLEQRLETMVDDAFYHVRRDSSRCLCSSWFLLTYFVC